MPGACGGREALSGQCSQHGMSEPAGAFSDAEGFCRIPTRVDLDHLGAGFHRCARMRQTSQAAIERRADDLVADAGDSLAFCDSHPDRAVRLESPVDRRIDIALAPESVDRPRLAGERPRRPLGDDPAQILPRGFHDDVGGLAGDEVGAEANRQRRQAGLPFRHRTLVHARVDEDEGTHKLEDPPEIHCRQRNLLTAFQCPADREDVRHSPAGDAIQGCAAAVHGVGVGHAAARKARCRNIVDQYRMSGQEQRMGDSGANIAAAAHETGCHL